MQDQTSEQIRAHRNQLKKTYGSLFDSISAILFRHDPVGINFETNTDEYDPEAGTILPRLKHCGSIEDVQGVVHEEFCNWFDAEDAGPPESYQELAGEIWHLWQNHPLRDAKS